MKIKSYPSDINFILALEHSTELIDYTNYLRAVEQGINSVRNNIKRIESSLNRDNGEYIIPDDVVEDIKSEYATHYREMLTLHNKVYVPLEFKQIIKDNK